MTNEKWLNTLSVEKKARVISDNCAYCTYHEITEWLNKKHLEPMPEIKIGDVLDVVLEDGCWYNGFCVAKGIVYILGECICKEIKEVKIKSISRWSSGGMEEIWRADNE